MENHAETRMLEELGRRIRARRAEICLSQEKLAEKADISTDTVSRIERGSAAMSIQVFIRLVRILGMDADRLLGMERQGGEKGRQCRGVLARTLELERQERAVVLQTICVLVDELHGQDA